MAIYGIGALYSPKDVTGEFIKRGMACIGWDDRAAQPLHGILKHIKVGDIIYIKAHPPQVGLIIKAVGIVVSDKVRAVKNLGRGIPVRWVWKEAAMERMGKLDDKYPVRNITLYEEFNSQVQRRIVDLLLSRVDHE